MHKSEWPTARAPLRQGGPRGCRDHHDARPPARKLCPLKPDERVLSLHGMLAGGRSTGSNCAVSLETWRALESDFVSYSLLCGQGSLACFAAATSHSICAARRASHAKGARSMSIGPPADEATTRGPLHIRRAKTKTRQTGGLKAPRTCMLHKPKSSKFLNGTLVLQALRRGGGAKHGARLKQADEMRRTALGSGPRTTGLNPRC
jgi:hypothetical protein